MDNPDRAKYYIYNLIESVLLTCKNPTDLRFGLQKFGIELDYKYKRTVREIEGVSFRYSNFTFKGSEIDREFSFGKLQKIFDSNILEARKKGHEEYLQEQMEQKTQIATQIKQHFLTKQNPESFVRYRKYEMRLMDKMRNEAVSSYYSEGKQG